MRNCVVSLFGLLLAGCTSDAEWHARASMAASESAARQAEAFARAQQETATAAIWAMVWPLVLLIVGGVLLIVVALIAWDRYSQRQARREELRLAYMAAMLELPAPQRTPLALMIARATYPSPADIAAAIPPRRGWQLAPGETPACMRPLQLPPQQWEADQ